VGWCDHHNEFRGGPDNLFCSAGNEENTSTAALWYLQVLYEADKRDINVSVGGFGTGQPSDAEYPALDPILRFMATHPKRAIFDCHCYFRALAWCDFARDARHPSQWPTKAPTDNAALHLLGRFRRILARADHLKVARPRIVVGEFGPDRVHAVPANVYGDTGGLLHTINTWRGWGVGDAEDYGAAMFRAAWKVFYEPYPEVIGICLFTVTDHPTHWGEWNGWYAPRLLDGITTGFDRMSTPTPTYKPYAPGNYILKGNGVRTRTKPGTDAPINGTWNTGATLLIRSTLIDHADDYGWQQVHIDMGGGYVTVGYMALHGAGVTWSLSPVPVTPAPDRYAALAAQCRATSAVLRAEADKLDAIATEAEAL
jgi:hypothetical protein